MARVVPNLESMRLYRGRGGEVMRGAACRLLEVCALLRMPCATKAALEKLRTVDECLKHPTEAISLAAVAALEAVTAAYFPTPPLEQSTPDDAPEDPRPLPTLTLSPALALALALTLTLTLTRTRAPSPRAASVA